MRIVLAAASGVLFFLAAGTLLADAPELKSGVKIQDGTAFLEVTYYSAPTVADWNNDGAKDLIVGQSVNGHIWLFLNRGTDLNPSFQGGELIKSGGVPISTSYG